MVFIKNKKRRVRKMPSFGKMDASRKEIFSQSEELTADRLLEVEMDRLGEIESALSAKKRLTGGDNYSPNRKQYQGHLSAARIVLYCGGNRAGKSTFGAMEIYYAMTKRYPEWYPARKRFSGAVRAVVSATSFGVVMRVVEPKLTSLFPRGEYSVKRTAQGFPSQYKFKDGSILDVLTLEMDLMAFQGADWDLAWLDEPQSKPKFLGITRGLVDRRGRMLITFTPLTEPWMKEDLADQADGKHIDLITVDIRDNMKNVDGDNILTEEAIKEFESTMPDEYRETMLHGKFFHLRGAIYQEFGDEHIKTFEYDKKSPVICVCDPHDRVPHHVIWAFLDRDNDIFVDYEMVTHMELPDLAAAILRVEKERGYNMKKRLIDPNFGRKPAKVGTNLSVMRELAKWGCGFYEANDNIELGHMTVREYLHYDRTKEISAINKPKLFFCRERCGFTIKSMRNLQYEDWVGKTAGEKDPKEVEKDKENHGADCVRYLVIGQPRYSVREPTPELSEAPY